MLERSHVRRKAVRAARMSLQGNTGEKHCSRPQCQCHKLGGIIGVSGIWEWFLPCPEANSNPRKFVPDERCLRSGSRDRRLQCLQKWQLQCKWSNAVVNTGLAGRLIPRHPVSVFYNSVEICSPVAVLHLTQCTTTGALP